VNYSHPVAQRTASLGFRSGEHCPVQESVFRAIRYLDGFRGEDARAWLLTIVRNYCYTWQSGKRTYKGK
jgi:hypothetical protein